MIYTQERVRDRLYPRWRRGRRGTVLTYVIDAKAESFLSGGSARTVRAANFGQNRCKFDGAWRNSKIVVPYAYISEYSV